MAPTPTFKVPPPPAAKAKGNEFDRFVRAHPELKQYKTVIQQWAGEFGVPALWVAATLLFESGGKNSGLNSSGHGFGLAQINPKVWFGKVFGPTGETITQEWASKPGNAIAFAAWLLSRGNPGSLQDAYLNNYNPGYKGSGPWSLLKGYKVTVSGVTPQQAATGAAARDQAKAALPADQVKQTRLALDPIYLAYTGRRATMAEVQAYIKNPVSQYQLENTLANPSLNPRIFKSPIYATNYARYEAAYKNVFGPDAVAPKSALLFGIAHSLDETAFQQELRDGTIPGQAAYNSSAEYKGLSAQYTASYAQIYGLPDDTGKQAIDQAVKKGFTQDQWNLYLRSQPEYNQSGEYKARSIDLASRMGLIQGTQGGAQTVLSG